MSGKPLSEAEKDVIAEMRGRGRSYQMIARKLRRSINTILTHCLAYGVDPDELPAYSLRPPNVGGMVLRCKDRTINRFTAEEDVLLLRLSQEGLPLVEIARQMNRRRNSIKMRLSTLARHEERQERARQVAA